MPTVLPSATSSTTSSVPSESSLVPTSPAPGSNPTGKAAEAEQVEAEGVLEVLDEDGPTEGRRLYFLESAGRRYALHFATSPPKDLRTGTRIHVSGVEADGTLTLHPGSASLQAMEAAPAPATLGEQKTLVILVNFQDSFTQPWTIDAAHSVVFDETNKFFLENSYQQTWLSGDVVGWYTIPLVSAVCDHLQLASFAKSAAAAAGVDLFPYTHFIYAFPKNACGWWGAATIGGNPSQAWINSNLQLAVVGHEMGHNLGLEHSHSLMCQDGTSVGPSCGPQEYGDGLDIMGWSPSGHFNAFQKERLGWLNDGTSPPITTVRTGGTYTLDPYEPTGSNPKALKILKGMDAATGASTWYYVEFRQAIGFDGLMANGASPMDIRNIRNGVVIHVGSEDGGADTSTLLDLTPATHESYVRDPALSVGQTFADLDAGVTITTQWVNSSNAGVSVSLGRRSCVHESPSLTLSPAQSQGGGSRPASYTVSVTNNDSGGCNAASFNLQAIAPGGWMAAFSSPTVMLSPGGSASTSLTITSPAAAGSGSYTIAVTATNRASTGHTASASAAYLIGESIIVMVSTDQLSYTWNQSVSVTATVSSGVSPIAGASLTFTITKPNGEVVTVTGTTGKNGTAVYKLRHKNQDPVGTYRVGVFATGNTLSGIAATTFTVQ